MNDQQPKKKRGRGRPRGSPPGFETQIYLRCHDTMKEAIDAYMKKYAIPTESEAVRAMVREALIREGLLG